MKSHELARKLLDMPDVEVFKVCMNCRWKASVSHIESDDIDSFQDETVAPKISHKQIEKEVKTELGVFI